MAFILWHEVVDIANFYIELYTSYLCITGIISQQMVVNSVVTVIEIGSKTAVFQQNRTETEVLCLSVDGFMEAEQL